MAHTETPKEAHKSIERDTAPGIGRQVYDETRPNDCQEFSRAELAPVLARIEAEEAEKKRTASEDPQDPFKRISFKIANEDFAKFVGHKPTPEPLERLFDTTTLVRMLALQNADGSPKRIFVWRSWMWMPAALLVAASFIVGGYLAMKPTKNSLILTAASAVTAPKDNSPETQPVATVTPPPQPSISAEASPIVKLVPKSEPKRVRKPTGKLPAEKPNGEPPPSPFAATPFTPVE